ncbi:glycosyltransferase [Pelagibacterium lentulum]|uniref:Glycosyl transferase family 1 n=1 Tax=Pelagibacterium lentulum TaxID=2029865 RepID=A0A916VXY2_9HYPH|nr:glycosyltransferase [Pelagibacterium lentulum]GGA51308.1 glycosyl transferase family 1 [Pelagibacterium lentulum]
MSKRIAIATIGTQGDVQPYVALARALKARGYSVVVGAPDDFEDMVTSHDLEFASLGSRIQEFLTQTRFEKAMSENMLVNMPSLLRQGQQLVDTAARLSWDMAQGADAIIVNMNTSFGIDIAEALDIPSIMSALQPLNSTSEFPLCAYYGPSFGRAFNRVTYTAMTVQQIYYNLPRNKLRRELMGLEPRKKGGFFKDTDGTNLTTLYAYSAHVSPRPRDWPKNAIVSGYWMLPDNTGWQPDAAFKAFLAQGDAPIYIGFGSMPFGAERNTEILKEAMRLWGGRAVVARGWGGINPDDLPPSIFAIQKAPHDQLFKHVKGVVHHGGAGTTAAGLHLGLPTFIVPQAVDQPFWGRRIYELGCGPKPVRLRKLTPELLAEALRALDTNAGYARNAQILGEKLRAEDGTANAIKVIERVMANYQTGRHRQRA